MLLYPVQEGQLILGQLRKNLRLLVALAQLRLHILYHIRDSRVSLMLVEGLEEVKLGVLLDLHAQVVQLLDGRVAGQEIKGSRSKADDLKTGQAHQSPRDGQELMDHIRALLSGAHRVLRNISAHIAQL